MNNFSDIRTLQGFVSYPPRKWKEGKHHTTHRLQKQAGIK